MTLRGRTATFRAIRTVRPGLVRHDWCHTERVASPNHPDVSILIVTYRSAELIGVCLRSITEHTTSSTVEIVIVDNNSPDNTVDLIRRDHPDVVLIASDENLGFAKGMNTAAAAARGEYLMLLNPDMELTSPAVDNIVAFARSNPGHGLYGGRTVNADGSVNISSCWGLPTPWSLTCFAFGLNTFFKRSDRFDPESLGSWERDSVREVGIITGCLVLAERDAWDALDGFDETYWMYGEDADLSMRAHTLGYRPIITPDAEAFHEIAASSPDKLENFLMVYKGKSTTIRRHFVGWRAPYGMAMIQLGVGLRGLGQRMLGISKRKPASEAYYWQLFKRRKEWASGY